MDEKEAELRYEQAQETFIDAARAFGANFLRVSADGGKFDELSMQFVHLYRATANYERICYELPDQDWHYALSHRTTWAGRSKSNVSTQLEEWPLDRVIDAALQLAGSRLAMQPNQVALAQSRLERAISDFFLF
jgi:hypothetical protein